MAKKSVIGLFGYGAAALLSAALTYACKDNINYYVNTARFCNAAHQAGFVSKEQSFNLSIVWEKNDDGYLETYIEQNGAKYEILSRADGIMVGDAYHNWNNFGAAEKKNVISSEIRNAGSQELDSFVSTRDILYLLDKIPNKTSNEIIDGFVKTRSKEDLFAMLNSIDYENLWDAIPKEKKKEILIDNIKNSTKRSFEDLKIMLRGFWGDNIGY